MLESSSDRNNEIYPSLEKRKADTPKKHEERDKELLLKFKVKQPDQLESSINNDTFSPSKRMFESTSHRTTNDI